MFAFTKVVKLLGLFRRHPRDALFLPVSILFGYLHGFIKLYALCTLNMTSWGSRADGDANDEQRLTLAPECSPVLQTPQGPAMLVRYNDVRQKGTAGVWSDHPRREAGGLRRLRPDHVAASRVHAQPPGGAAQARPSSAFLFFSFFLFLPPRLGGGRGEGRGLREVSSSQGLIGPPHPFSGPWCYPNFAPIPLYRDGRRG